MKITLDFQSDGNDTRYIRATWLPVGKRAGNETTRVVGNMKRHWVGGMQTLKWTAMIHDLGGTVTMRRDTEQEARQAVCDYLERNGPWWFATRRRAAS